MCGKFSPGKTLMQLPAACELVVHSVGNEDSALSKFLPHRASLPHLVMLGVHINVDTCTPEIDFSCLASCPRLRDFWLSVGDYYGNTQLQLHLKDELDWVYLSTLNDVPTCCSLVLGFRDADINMATYEPPAGWSITPYHDGEDHDGEELICF